MIRILPPEVVNQIAAGEVVERPSSIVKELVENSLDAGATRIRIEVRDGGRASVRITDDGQGFSAEDLELAFASHATSKLGRLEDLDHIASLGFRGEALASIGSVSRATIRSRRAGRDDGFQVVCDGGTVGGVRPFGCPVGAVIEVRDLFFNTPARRRFLKSAQAERGRIQDFVARLALSRLDVDFTLIADDRELLRLPATDDLRDRIRRTFGDRVADHLLDVRLEWGDCIVSGVAGDPDLARRDSTLELLWVNGRLAKERAATFAMRQPYREFLMGGRFPVYFVSLSLPPDLVDVNVHPTKSEIRFLESRRVCGLLHEALKLALSGRIRPRASALSVGEGKPSARSGFPALPRELFGRAALPAAPAAADGPSAPAPEAAPAPAHPFSAMAGRRFLQVLDLYLVFETEDGMTVVDQHALHERVLYERFRRRHDARAEIPIQRLLVPEVVELTATDKTWLLEARDVLAREGLLVDDFGGASVAVHGIPALLDRADPRKLIGSLLGGAGEGDPRPRAATAIVERFHSMACRAAVMSGDRLTDDEIRALLEEAVGLEHPHNCPHGRPTVLSFDRRELERFFRRRV